MAWVPWFCLFDCMLFFSSSGGGPAMPSLSPLLSLSRCRSLNNGRGDTPDGRSASVLGESRGPSFPSARHLRPVRVKLLCASSFGDTPVAETRRAFIVPLLFHAKLSSSVVLSSAFGQRTNQVSFQAVTPPRGPWRWGGCSEPHLKRKWLETAPLF